VSGRWWQWCVLALRYLMALFFVGAAINKWTHGWLWTDKLHRVFIERLGEVDPESFGAWFLEHVGIPYYGVFAALVTLGETAIALGLLFGCVTRGAAIGAMICMSGFAIGGYYDASLIVLALMFLPLVLLPTGRWLGLDRRLHARHPNSIWFK
jgi:thiosulfate dehydrogenase [quinone] large subunit